ncbi:MAG: EAL domain-containing protein, partial [Lysobacteraceae bacterium]
AEGIETAAELRTLKEIGIRLCQGYLLAQPATEVLPVIDRERLRT